MHVIAKNKKDARIEFEKRYPSNFKSIVLEKGADERVLVIIPKGYKLYKVSHSTKRK